MTPFDDMSREELLRVVEDNQSVMSQWIDAVERVRQLHSEIFLPSDIKSVCEWDDEVYPCVTIEALDGEL